MVVSGSPNGSQPTSQPAKKYGITKPISVAGPTEADLQRNIELEKVRFFFLLKFIFPKLEIFELPGWALFI